MPWVLLSGARTMTEHELDELTAGEVDQIVRNGQNLLVLWRGLPDRVFFRTWERFALGCVTQAYHSLRRILEIDDDGPNTVTLARPLFNHVVALAWLTGDPETRLPLLLRGALASGHAMGMELLQRGDAVLVESRLMAEMKKNSTGQRAPDVRQQADVAESEWAVRVPRWGWGFIRQYSSIFRPYSWFVHPTQFGIAAFFDEDGHLVFDPTDAGIGSVRAQAVAGFADALVIASEIFAWPSFEAVLNAYTYGMVE